MILCSSAILAQNSRCVRNHPDVTGVWILSSDRVLLYFKIPPGRKLVRLPDCGKSRAGTSEATEPAFWASVTGASSYGCEYHGSTPHRLSRAALPTGVRLVLPDKVS